MGGEWIWVGTRWDVGQWLNERRWEGGIASMGGGGGGGVVVVVGVVVMER